MWRIIESIKSVIYWLPVIWKDRHWDHSFIYLVLRHKLKGVENCLRTSKYSNCEKQADRVKLCVLLLDRLIQNDYHDIAFRHYYQRYGEPTWEEFVSELKEKCCGDKQDYEHFQCIKDSLFLEKQDISYLFQTMA